MKRIALTRRYLQEVVFGFEDSLVSTVGAMTGIAAGAGSRSIVILAGLVIVVVEATSMAAGSYLSSRATNDAQKVDGAHPQNEKRFPLVAGVVMGASYLFAGGVPLSAYLFLPVDRAVECSILFSLTALFLLGVWQTKFTKRSRWKSGFEMALVGGAAIVVGFFVGRLASQLLGIDAL